jgi:heptosyltransferase-1
MRVLIVKTSSMGDVVHALPLASDIARAFPGAGIEWVVEEAFAAIPCLHSSVTGVVTVALRRWRRAPWSPRTWRELRAARAALRSVNYDAIVDCQGLLKSALIARSARGPVAGPCASSAREKVASWFYDRKITIDRALHAVDRARRLGAAALEYPVDGPPRFGLRVPAGDRYVPARLPVPAGEAPYAVLLTNASRTSKLWSDSRWSEVERWLAEQEIESLLPWGTEAEHEATRRRAASMRRARVLPRLPLDQLAAVLARSAVAIGLDTGLTHLAAACGVPAVGIFCDYDTQLVGLRGARVESLGGVGQQPEAAAVIEAAQRVTAALHDEVRAVDRRAP